jgi:hypothetical protein
VTDDLMIGDGDDHGLRIERGADITVFAVGRENLHARSRRYLDARLLLKILSVEHGDVILTADGDPDLLAIGREERLVRRAADIGGLPDRVGRGIDEGHGVAADRDHRNGLMVRREAHAVDKHLSLIERTEIAGLRIAKPDNADELVVDRIGDRDGVGKLLRRINPVVMADGNIRIRRRSGRLPGPGRRLPSETDTREKTITQHGLRHLDRALMMRRHHRNEITVDVAARLDHHVGHHLVHGGVVFRQIRRFLGKGRTGRRRAKRQRRNHERRLILSRRDKCRDACHRDGGQQSQGNRCT